MALKSTGGLGKPFGALTTNQAAAAGNMGLTAEEIRELQPYLDFDLKKVISTTAHRSPNQTYGITSPYQSGQMTAPTTRDVTQEYGKLLEQVRSRGAAGANSVYGTGGNVSQYSDLDAYRDVYGNVQLDAAGKPIPMAQDRWNDQLGTRAGVGAPATYQQTLARQFQVDNPGYFQIGQDPANKGSYDAGKLSNNNIPGLTDDKVAGLVKYDPKYGYIAPIEIRKEVEPDWLSKYGKYLPLAAFGAGMALTAAAGAGGAAAAGGSTAAGGTTGASGLTAAEMAALEATAASEIATGGIGAGVGGIGAGGGGSTFAAGIGGTAAAGTGATVVPNVTSGAAAAGNTSGGSQGLFGSNTAAPITQGTPTSVGLNPGSATPGLFSETGKLGSAALGSLGGGGGGGGGLLSGLSGLGGGSANLISTLIGAGLSAYQAQQMAKALEVGDKSTDYSRTSGGHTSFDPSIRALQDEALHRTDDQYEGVMGYGKTFRARSDEDRGEYQKLYAELTGNQNPFIKARVDPVREQIASSRGAMERGQGLRGIGGSSFGNDALTKFDFAGTRELGNAGSLATQEALGARTGVLGSIAGLNQNRLTGETSLTNTLNTLNSNRTGIATDRANLERAGLGLSAGDEAANRAAEQAKQEQYRMMLQRLLGGTE